MEFSGKMGLKIILQVIKNEGFTLSLQDTVFKKPQGEVKLTPPTLPPPPHLPFLSLFRVNEFVIDLKGLLEVEAKCLCFDNSLPFPTNFIRKKTPTQELSCKFCKFLSNQFFSHNISG